MSLFGAFERVFSLFFTAGTFLKALAYDGAISEESISTDTLNANYGPLRTNVSESIQKQEKLIAKIQEANACFSAEKSGNEGGVARENMLKMLASSHDAYMELTANLTEGNQFYNNLTPLLARIQQKVSDFCFVRKTETDDLMQYLQKNIVTHGRMSAGEDKNYLLVWDDPSKEDSKLDGPSVKVPYTDSSKSIYWVKEWIIKDIWKDRPETEISRHVESMALYWMEEGVVDEELVPDDRVSIKYILDKKNPGKVVKKFRAGCLQLSKKLSGEEGSGSPGPGRGGGKEGGSPKRGQKSPAQQGGGEPEKGPQKPITEQGGGGGARKGAPKAHHRTRRGGEPEKGPQKPDTEISPYKEFYKKSGPTRKKDDKMTAYLFMPLKKSSEIDVVTPLKSFIAATYSSDDRPFNADNIVEFGKLRTKAVVSPLDKTDSSLEIIYRYYDQLNAIEAKLPLTATQIPVPFKWKDAFDRGGILWGKASFTLSSGSYEKACVLFNVAALQSQVAASQQHDTDEEVKTTAKLFQLSAGILSYLREHVLSMVQQESTFDLSPDCLAALSALMLAQAQETIYLKAARDNMKAATVAKIAAQAADYFQEAAKLMSKESVKGTWEKEWLGSANGKFLMFTALSQYHQSVVSKEAKEIGEELSRLQEAVTKMKQAQNYFGSQMFLNEIGKIQRAHDTAKKDNDFIYHERIPDIKTLSVVQKVPLAKALPVQTPMCARFKDLFESLVPVAVHQALAAYELRKTEVINGEVARIREHTQLLNGLLTSMNLPAALDDACNAEVLPESVRDKSSKVKQAGGEDALRKMFEELPQLAMRNREMLDETNRLLTEEKSSDDQLRSQFKDRWTRMQSEKLTEPLWQELGKYKSILDTAQNADKIVKQKYDTNQKGIELLSKTEPELKTAIPTISGGGGQGNSPAVKELRALMQEVDAVKAERDGLEKEFKDKTFDISGTFLKALADDGAISEESISTDTLNANYGPLRTNVSESIQKQEKLIAKIQEANARFAAEKSGNQGGVARENMLKMLASSHDAYMELTANLTEGTKFYNNLTPLLVRLQQKVSDFCFARKTEKDDLMQDLQKNIVNQPTQGAPTTPGYHASGDNKPNQPPPRPPPPQMQMQSTAPQGNAPPPATGPTPPAAAPYPTQNPPTYYPGYPQSAGQPQQAQQYQQPAAGQPYQQPAAGQPYQQPGAPPQPGQPYPPPYPPQNAYNTYPGAGYPYGQQQQQYQPYPYAPPPGAPGYSNPYMQQQPQPGYPPQNPQQPPQWR